jgi:regulator of sirC expression with transglutaminase-like and TPR domain
MGGRHLPDSIRVQGAPSAVATVRQLLSQSDESLDFAHAAAALDKLVDPSAGGDRTLAEVDRLTGFARQIARPAPTENRTLSALRILLHRAGPWNGGRPFSYDHAAFKDPSLKLISNYLRTRRGNCVSMPILFLILADRLGIDAGLALAPSHLFVRVKDVGGVEINLETTSATRSPWRTRARPAFI